MGDLHLSDILRILGEDIHIVLPVLIIGWPESLLSCLRYLFIGKRISKGNVYTWHYLRNSLALHFAFVINLWDGSLPGPINQSLEDYVVEVPAVCYLCNSCQLDDFHWGYFMRV